MSVTAARRLGRYELGETLGTGGVAEVIRATVVGAGAFRKAVVIKRIRPELRDVPEVRAAFVREAELSQRLRHGNVVQALDLGDDDGVPYLVLELVEGCTLQRVLDDAIGRGKPIPVAAALYVVEQVAAALAYVHGARGDDGAPLGLVHRDVTPANVLLGRDGVVKLTDFGIARAAALGSDTLPGFIKGTALYLAPEQAAGRPVDGRADVFALGLVLRRLLVGDGPTDGLDPELAAIVEHATEPAVRDRLASADALLERLQRHRAKAGIEIGSARLAAIVEAACGVAARRAIALDRALGSPEPARTRQIVAAAPPTPAARWRWLAALGLGLAVVGAVWAWPRPADPPSPAIEVVAAPAPEPVAVVPPKADPELDAMTPTGIPGVTPAGTTTGEPEPPSPTPVDRRVRRGRLLVNVVPYAQVSLDGKPLGDTPIDQRVRAGKHTVELYNPDTARRRSIRVTIDPDEPVNITHW